MGNPSDKYRPLTSDYLFQQAEARFAQEQKARDLFNDESIPDREVVEQEKIKRLNDEYRKLLGPLVPALLRNAEGALDLSKIQVNSFAEFKAFLAAQVSIDDHVTMSDPYESLLESDIHEDLLRSLYLEIDPSFYSVISADDLENTLTSFQIALVEIDADAFARNFSANTDGRKRLASLIHEDSPMSKDLKCDLVKAIGEVGEDQGVGGYGGVMVFNNISSWNFFNIGVSHSDLANAARGAEILLEDAQSTDDTIQSYQKDFAETARANAKVSDELLSEEQVLAMGALAKNTDPGAVEKMKAHLAKVWLMAADNRNWRNWAWRDGSTEDKNKVRRYILGHCESLLEELDQVDSSQSFAAVQEKIQSFVEDSVDHGGFVAWVDDQVNGRNIQDLTAQMPEPIRAPLQQLVHAQDSYRHSMEMGGNLLLKTPEVMIADLKVLDEATGEEKVLPLRQEVLQLIEKLEQTKHGLWHGYKQHKFISRAASNVADAFGGGDIRDIEAAQETLNGFIHRLTVAQDLQELGKIYDELTATLSVQKDGTLFKALQAAEMDGGEQILGLAQTIAIMAATSLLLRGANLVVKGLQIGKAAKTVKDAAAVVQEASHLEKMAHGFKTGALLTVEENALAVASGEVRDGPETLGKWTKDAISTGVATALSAGLAPGAQAKESLMKNLWARYSTQGIKGVGHLALDTGIEILEEGFDQSLRKSLDGKRFALKESELIEVMKISAVGGGTKVGIVAESISSNHSLPLPRG